MPTTDFTAKLLELKEVIINDLVSTNTEIHVHFSLKRRTHSCPSCQTLTDKVHDYKTSVLKIYLLWAKKTFW
jgi:transposase